MRGCNGKREGKGRFNIWIERSILDQIRVEARGRSVPMQRIAETVLAERYNPKDKEDQMGLILRRLNLMDERLRTLERLAEVQAELVGVFMRCYFTNTPELPLERKEAAWREAQLRYDRCLVFVAKRLKENQSVFTELPEGVVFRGDGG